jgi:hypothetical protein
LGLTSLFISKTIDYLRKISFIVSARVVGCETLSARERNNHMKKVLTMLLLAMMTAACSGPSYMVWKPETRDIWSVKPLPGKSAIVVARTSSSGSDIEFETFLDRRMIGATKGPGYFVKRNVEPGPHYIVTRADFMQTSDTVSEVKSVGTSVDTAKTTGNGKNGTAPPPVVETVKIIETAKITRTAKIQFEPDTVYYLLQTPRIEDMITVAPVSPDYLIREMDSSCAFLDYEALNPVADIADPEFREIAAGYEREAVEGLHKEFALYRGIRIDNNRPAPESPGQKK